MRPWIIVADRLPEEGCVVETKISDWRGERNIARLYRRGKLWFLPDGSMYVYYTPTHWRGINSKSHRQRFNCRQPF